MGFTFERTGPTILRWNRIGTVYPTEQGPVTTRRWEASREGIQDFELLWLLRKTAEQSPLPERKAALELVDAAVSFSPKGLRP